MTKKHFRRKRFGDYSANLSAYLIGIDACPGARFLARVL